MSANTNDLSDELISLLQGTDSFRKRNVTVFDVDDFAEITKTGSTLPMAGVQYEGGTVLEPSTDRPSSGSLLKAMMEVGFSVTLAIEYRAIGDDDTKRVAMDMLQELRLAIMGYKGVNSRPWVLLSEFPIESEFEGVIFYGQLWKTIIPIKGNFKQS